MGKQKQARLKREAEEAKAEEAKAAEAPAEKAPAIRQASTNHKPKGYSGYPSISR
jgi:hypothetical protein